jgi:hypothetical protein
MLSIQLLASVNGTTSFKAVMLGVQHCNDIAISLDGGLG